MTPGTVRSPGCHQRAVGLLIYHTIPVEQVKGQCRRSFHLEPWTDAGLHKIVSSVNGCTMNNAHDCNSYIAHEGNYSPGYIELAQGIT
jgi:hypothetical protein